MKRFVILGIGNRFRGDDGVGPEVIKVLSKKIKMDNVKLIDCDVVPENFLNEIEEFKPNTILIVDAISTNKTPGEIVVIKSLDADFVLSTHRVPLSILVKYLKTHMNVKTVLIGIQVKDVKFGSKMSEEVRRSIKNVIKIVNEMIVAGVR